MQKYDFFNGNLTRVKNERELGVIFDETQTFEAQIEKCIIKAKQKFMNI